MIQPINANFFSKIAENPEAPPAGSEMRVVEDGGLPECARENPEE
jgi:hypothetical protein